ncbi:MAG: NAD(+) synthase [Akkermansiaceae bacterium]|nr:NAD(+) synthase [Akkermansiaceae bacterium]
MSTYGFYRVAAAVPRLRVADVDFNLQEILACIRAAAESGTAALVFPELCLTGYSCGDLFHQPTLQQAALAGLKELSLATRSLPLALVVGLPLRINDALYNVAAVLQGGRVLGFVPKTVLPDYREFYERRQFTPAARLRQKEVTFGGRSVPAGTDLIFENEAGDFRFGVEICEDLWSVIPPSCSLALSGALLILNPSASTELAGKAEYRRALVRQQSARCLAGYVLASAGVHESTQDVVYGGHALIAENGRISAENKRFARTSTIIRADIDCHRLAAARLSESSFNTGPPLEAAEARRIRLGRLPVPDVLEGILNPAHPFLPDEADRAGRCEEILSIQTAGLARRIEHTRARKLVIGVSGGLDSTLALLVASRTCRLLELPADTIMAVTMPGFGTTGRTHDNALALCRQLGTELREADIREACLLHFRSIGHRAEERTTTYENVQARERTQILMDLANKHGGLVIGTGDLSEIALGWSTYNGDHMSMYAVNCSIPKTLIRCLIEHAAGRAEPGLAAILADISATPVSPELLPPADDGGVGQRTEDILGPYDLHDFFLYHMIKYGAPPEKMLFLAGLAFDGQFSPALIRRTLRVFLSRFFSQQFKRSCMPDGPKVGTIALSPRGDWRMPSDAQAKAWLDRCPD